MSVPQKKTVAMVISGVLIAVIPSFIGYLQNRDEIKAKYAQTQTNASSGYDALAASVKELQTATLAQHDYIVKMQGQLETMEKLVIRLSTRTWTGRPPTVATVDEPPHKALPKPPDPKFDKLPDSFDAAQMKRPPKM